MVETDRDLNDRAESQVSDEENRDSIEEMLSQLTMTQHTQSMISDFETNVGDDGEQTSTAEKKGESLASFKTQSTQCKTKVVLRKKKLNFNEIAIISNIDKKRDILKNLNPILRQK